MKRMKAILVFLLAATMLTSCGNSDNKDVPKKTDMSAKLPANASTSWYDNIGIVDRSDDKKTVDQKADHEEELPRLVERGIVSFRSGECGPEVKVPLFGIAASYGIGLNSPTVAPSSPLPEISFAIPADQQDQLAVFWVNLGEGRERGILLPGLRIWRPIEAVVGADGSVGISLENPNDPREMFTYYDTSGGCQGCAIADIATYFPSLRKWAEEQAFPGTEMKFLRQILLSPRIMAYSKGNIEPGYEINGVAYQQHEQGNAWFRTEEMSSAVSKHRLATTVLNFFVEQYDIAKKY